MPPMARMPSGSSRNSQAASVSTGQQVSNGGANDLAAAAH